MFFHLSSICCSLRSKLSQNISIFEIILVDSQICVWMFVFCIPRCNRPNIYLTQYLYDYWINKDLGCRQVYTYWSCPCSSLYGSRCRWRRWRSRGPWQNEAWGNTWGTWSKLWWLWPTELTAFTHRTVCFQTIRLNPTRPSLVWFCFFFFF